MTDKICKLAKNGIKGDPKKFKNLVSKANFICKKCYRTACDKGHLCKPQKM